MISLSKKTFRYQDGFSLPELLVAAVVSSIIILAGSTLYFNSVKNYHDRYLQSQADETAQYILNMIAFDTRMAGNGMPDTSSWSILPDDADSLFPGGTASIITGGEYGGSGDSTIMLRYAPTGRYSVISTATTTSNTSLDVVSVVDLSIRDLAYISTVPVNGSVVTTASFSNIAGTTVTLETIGYDPVATLPVGSTITRVKEVMYTSESLTKIYYVDGIEGTPVALTPTASSVSFQYYDAGKLTTYAPTDVKTFQDNVALVNIIVAVASSGRLTDGRLYVGYAEGDVALRTIQIHRQQRW